MSQIPSLTTDGTTISNLGEFAALIIAFATVSALNEIPVARFVKFLKDGWSNRLVLTIMGLTTVIPTLVPCNSWCNPSENPNMANFVADYDAMPGIPKLPPTDATLTMWPESCFKKYGKNDFVQ